ncbi:type II toxin-antitoxin system VapC family toxin [Sphingobium boeckii]|uniref:PIN domain nuclease of toxin-antitoxin system n=1 Tax=Sphingobium boeckii TaxID=1082345 RepID=A0A7W9ALE5_9SPHN|nr:type II toxin-antitoxin system VapC family toxin [Sphingobium boeckii]MBB5687597.1 PIN domain nuclease of toxin-antitoxin system [Sphingobium boeckii]
MILLDTHIALWLATERQTLTFREMSFLNDAGSDLRVSAVSLWELRIKWNSYFKSGEGKGRGDPSDVLGALVRMNVGLIALEPEHTTVPLIHPLDHKDPFDELLLVQAQELGLKLLTRDTKLRGHPLAYSPE